MSTPSPTVINGAREIRQEGRIAPLSSLATYEVESSSGRHSHLVTITMQGGKVTGHRCSCDAGKYGVMCRHVLAVLAEH